MTLNYWNVRIETELDVNLQLSKLRKSDFVSMLRSCIGIWNISICWTALLKSPLNIQNFRRAWFLLKQNVRLHVIVTLHKHCLVVYFYSLWKIVAVFFKYGDVRGHGTVNSKYICIVLIQLANTVNYKCDIYKYLDRHEVS